MTRPGEFDIIERYFAPLAAPGSFGLKDDAALLRVPEGGELVVTQDAILEGIHFLDTDPMDTIAHKALAVNASDCAAKGARPFAYSLALGLPDRLTEPEIAAFAEGLKRAQALFGVELTGGDTYRSPDRLAVSVSMFGTVRTGQYKSRMGAQVGDVIAVSNTIGEGALGLQVALGQLASSRDDLLLKAYQTPRPPVELAGAIQEFASASMDISDGLLGDCVKLLGASGVAGTVERDSIPLSEYVAALADEKIWNAILSGGDDYQVLFTVPANRWRLCQQRVSTLAETTDGLKHQITPIGKVITGVSGALSLTVGGVSQGVETTAYTHF